MSKKTYSIRVRVRRTTHEYADISVPLEGHVDLNDHVDADEVFATALRLAESSDIQWKPDGILSFEPHPIQGG